MSLQQASTHAGFTLMELIIAVAIVSILALIAVPSYQDYSRQATYSEVVNQTSPYQVGVMSCYNTMGTLTGCDAASNGIPAGITGGTGVVASLTVTNGVVTVIPNNTRGITSEDTYVLTPIPPGANTNAVTWKSSGGGVDRGYAK